VQEPLRILFVEDVPADTELAERELRRAGLEFTSRRVETREEFVAAIEEDHPDVIVSDYRLPAFDGMAALAIARERIPQAPFIIATGSLNEETAVECMKAGAWDYILKDRLTRLPLAVQGALDLASARSEERRAQEALGRSEALLRAFLEASADGAFVKDSTLRTVMANPAYAAMLGRPLNDIVGYDDLELMPEGMARACRESDIVALHDARAVVTEESAFGRTFETRKFPVPLADGSVGLGGYIRDITERKTAERALRESEERLGLALESAGLGLWDADLETGKLTLSERWAELVGYTVADLAAETDPWLDRVHPDDLAGALRDVERHIVGETPFYESEHRLRTKTGEWVWVHDRGRVVERTADGKPRRFIGVQRDITERKRGEEDLRESERRLATLMANLPGMAYRCGNAPGWPMEFVSEGCAALIGWSPSDILRGRPTFSELILEDDRDAVWEAVQAAVARREPFEMTYRITHADAGVRWVWERGGGVFDADGQLVALEGFIADMTARVRAEEALTESEVLFRTTFQTGADAFVLVTEAEGRLVEANERFLELYGYTRDEVIGRTSLELGMWAEPESRDELLARLRADGRASNWEVKARRKSGETFWVLYSVSRLKIAGRALMLGAIRDITDRRRTEERLRESEARYRLIAENTADVIWTLDLATRRFTYMSPSVQKLRGFTAEEVIAQPFEAALTPDSRRRVEARLAATVAALAAGDETSRTNILEVEQPAKDGGVVPTEIVASVLSDEGGRASVVLGITRDITERRRAEAALRDSEERYRTLFQQSPIGIYRTTPDGRILLANPALLRMLGYGSLEELQLRNLEDDGFEPEYPRGHFKEAVDREGELRGFEAIWKTKDGHRLYVRENAHPVRDVDGTILYYEGSVEDVTAERAALEALRRSEEQYRRLFESANDSIVVFDPETETILDVNRKACELYGYSREELVGTSLKRLSTDVSRGERRIREVMGSKVLQGFETVHLRRDGTQIHLQVNAAVVEFGGRPAILSTNRDVTQQKRVEVERRRLAAAIEQTGEAVVITDRDGTIRYVNPAFEWITGYRGDEAIGANTSILKSGKQPPSFYAEMWATISSGSVWMGRLTNRRKDGGLYEEEMSISPVRDESGKIINFVAVKRDVTHEVELRQQLTQAQKMEAIGRLAGGIAHDFNNLLQALISQVQLLRSQATSPSKVTALSKELEQQVNRGASLTRQLLLFSRRETVKPERLDLNEAVRDASKMLQRLVRANIALGLELAPRALPIEADRGQLDQVLMNLTVNASDAMADGGRLTIRTGVDDQETVWLTVSDTGHGIAAEIRDRIFDPFFTTKESGKGTGLGLSVVHGIVTQHGGRIEVESTVGEGTTFRITLPRGGSGEFSPVEEAAPPLPDLPLGRGERILVVEDEAIAREGLREILASLGYEVVALGSGEEAGTLPDTPAFDLLLTDLMLPGVAGPALATGLKDRWPSLKVILMSGYAEDEAVRTGVGSGVVHFLQKPFDMATLAREVRAALDA